MTGVSRPMRWIRLTMAALLPCIPCSADTGGEKITLREGFPFVDVTINGRGPFRMLVDTGASITLLAPEAALDAGLEFDHSVLLATLSGDKKIPGASGNHVRVGESEQSGVAIVVTDMAEVRRLDRKASGVLGQSFFRRTAYLIDYQRKRLWLGEEATERSAQLPVVMPARESNGRTVLGVRLEPNGRVWQLTLDSGASGLVLDCSEVCPRMLGISGESQLVTHVGERPVIRGRIYFVEIGGMRLPSVEAAIVEGLPGGRRNEGLLPARWFSAVYVDSEVVRVAR